MLLQRMKKKTSEFFFLLDFYRKYYVIMSLVLRKLVQCNLNVCSTMEGPNQTTLTSSVCTHADRALRDFFANRVSCSPVKSSVLLKGRRAFNISFLVTFTQVYSSLSFKLDNPRCCYYSARSGLQRHNILKPIVTFLNLFSNRNFIFKSHPQIQRLL